MGDRSKYRNFEVHLYTDYDFWVDGYFADVYNEKGVCIDRFFISPEQLEENPNPKHWIRQHIDQWNDILLRSVR